MWLHTAQAWEAGIAIPPSAPPPPPPPSAPPPPLRLVYLPLPPSPCLRTSPHSTKCHDKRTKNCLAGKTKYETIYFTRKIQKYKISWQSSPDVLTKLDFVIA